LPLLGPGAREARAADQLHRLRLRPGHPSLHDDSYKNPPLLSAYVSEMGKIKPRNATGLTRRSQREVGKAVRRARAMGLMPVMSNQASRLTWWSPPSRRGM
jgi:small subunit ribosomal protein S18